jgi:hypothetical protein
MEESAPFRLEGNQIFSNSTGKAVAVVENGVVVMVAGYNTLTKKVNEFYAAGNFTDTPAAAKPAAEDPDYVWENEFAKDHTGEIEEKPEFADLGEGKTNVFVGGAPAATSPAVPAVEQPQGSADAQIVIDSIPDNELPALDPVLGINTREFKLFCKCYKLTDDQITALVRRCEAKLRG